MDKLPEETSKAAALKQLGVTVLTGFLIGIGSIAPGISGGAIAVVFGLYDRITDAIANFYKQFLQKMKFLIPLGIGAVVGILLFGKLIFFLFEQYNVQVRCLFIGLMVGTLPSVFRSATKKGFRWWYLLPMAAAAGLIGVMGYFETLTYTGGNAGLNFPILLGCGAVLGFGTIVPGVSSSFILMSVGIYDSVMQVIADMQIVNMIPLAIGFAGFVLLFAKLINWLYARAYGLISFIVCGFLIGSIFPVIPPLGLDLKSGLSLLLAVTGGLLSWYLMRLKINSGVEED